MTKNRRFQVYFLKYGNIPSNIVELYHVCTFLQISLSVIVFSEQLFLFILFYCLASDEQSTLHLKSWESNCLHTSQISSVPFRNMIRRKQVQYFLQTPRLNVNDAFEPLNSMYMEQLHWVITEIWLSLLAIYKIKCTMVLPVNELWSFGFWSVCAACTHKGVREVDRLKLCCISLFWLEMTWGIKVNVGFASRVFS